MKNLNTYFKPILALVFAVALFSCNNPKTKKEEAQKTDDATASTPFKAFLVKHTVADYAKWLPAYNANDSLRKAYGLTSYGLGRGLDDSNTIVVMNKMDDVQKAKDFTALPDLKDAMMKAGVTSAPEFSYWNVIRNDDSKIDQKERIMVTHHVKDFAAWLKVYDGEGKAKRMEEGMIDRGVARSVDDSNMVSLVFAITDMAKAKAAITSDAKKKLMTDAGVDSPPTIMFYKFEMQ